MLKVHLYQLSALLYPPLASVYLKCALDKDTDSEFSVKIVPTYNSTGIPLGNCQIIDTIAEAKPDIHTGVLIYKPGEGVFSRRPNKLKANEEPGRLTFAWLRSKGGLPKIQDNS